MIRIKEKRIIISHILLIVIIVIIVSIWQAYRIEKEMQDIESISEIKPQEFGVEVREREREREITTKLVPSRPEDYGIIVTSEFNKPKTQADWNEFLHRKLSEVKDQTSPQTLEKVRDKIKEEPEETQEKLAKIDKGIEDCQEILGQEPDNKDIQKKLERLMILKGLAEGFKDF